MPLCDLRQARSTYYGLDPRSSDMWAAAPPLVYECVSKAFMSKQSVSSCEDASVTRESRCARGKPDRSPPGRTHAGD
jgi:hypothetical protein